MKQEDKTKPEKDTYDIFVNGTPEAWPHKTMNYEQAVKLAFPDGPHGGNIKYSVTWTKPDGEEGSLRKGSKPTGVVDGISFDVGNTDKS